MKTRSLFVIGLLALVAAGCSDDAASPSTAEAVAATTQAPETSTSASGDTTATTQATTSLAATTTLPEATTAPATEGPAAPDFSLALADGSEFVLSGEQKPVYLVFWAEW
jgi:hypothetical protein